MGSLEVGATPRAAVAIALAAALLVGCAAAGSLKRTVQGWLGGEAPPRAHYVGVARARLYREPEASSEVVGELALHEGVLSYRVENGFAYVKTEKSGRTGWVDTRALIDQLPPAPKPAAPPPSTAAPGESPGSVEATPEPTREPEPEPEEPSPERSVFDPY